jgi:hypothetical protein
MAAQRFVIGQNNKAINILSQDKNLTRPDYLKLITLSSEGRPPPAKPAGAQVGRFIVKEG